MRNWRERGVDQPYNMSMIEWQNKQVLKELTQKYTQPTSQYTPTPQIGPPKPPQPIYDRNDSPSFGFWYAQIRIETTLFCILKLLG